MNIPVVSIGDVISGKYVVDGVIDDRGVGVVLAASHRELGLRVAIKFLYPQVAEQGVATERMLRAARNAARIRSDHVCRVLDVDTLETGVPYVVMEYLEGADLGRELERRSRLPLAEAVDYVLQACVGVGEAHAAGIVHRDLKPAKLFVAQRPDGSRCVKVLDSGVSKSLLAGVSYAGGMTQATGTMGWPEYISPEQLAEPTTVDAGADIWALGVVLYELLSGRTPFSGATIPQLVHSLLHDEPASLRSFGLQLPDGFDAVVLRALQKRSADRYENTAQLAAALAPFGSGARATATDLPFGIMQKSGAANGGKRATPRCGRRDIRESTSKRGRGASAAAQRSSGGELASKQAKARSRGFGARMRVIAAAAIALLCLGAWLSASRSPPRAHRTSSRKIAVQRDRQTTVAAAQRALAARELHEASSGSTIALRGATSTNAPDEPSSVVTGASTRQQLGTPAEAPPRTATHARKAAARTPQPSASITRGWSTTDFGGRR